MKLVPAVLCGLLLVGCSSSGSSKGDPRTATTTTLSAAQLAANRAARKEVAITSCAPNSAQHVEIKGTAHNTTAAPATYTVQLTISDQSGARRFATAAAANDVAPAAIACWNAVTTARYESGMKCSITSVSRTSP